MYCALYALQNVLAVNVGFAPILYDAACDGN